jgi:hypothetical protein
MTRRDYVKIAEALRGARTGFVRPNWNAAVDEVTAKLVGVLKADNPRFDEYRFYQAAGYGVRPNGPSSS